MDYNVKDNLFGLKCFYCGQFIKKHIKCNICGIALYCNQEHQRLHWETHQQQCEHVKVEPSQSSEFSNLELKKNLKQLPARNRETFPSSILSMKSCRTLPIYHLPDGVSKEEVIKRHGDYAMKALINDGYCVIDGLLGDAKLDCILTEIQALLDSGIMKDGELTQSTTRNRVKEHTRGDKVAWLTGEEETCRSIKTLINVIDHLITSCDGQFPQVIKGRTQAMAACYMGDGVGYKYHIDNAHKDGRCITCLYYMNKDWDSQRDGGVLRLYPHGKPSCVNIDPIGDRLLMFWSNSRTPHEVLPPFRKRFAITLWYFDAKEREEVRKSYLANLQQNFASR